jgi:predicted short-subunit dehydrogenase-like oxidoreductase (DUF2520 family)
VDHPGFKELSVTSTVYDVAIIGPGKVGTALGILYARGGYRVVAIGGRDPKRAELAASQIGSDTLSCNVVDAAHAADAIILSVTDDSIKDVCAQIAREAACRRGAVLIHCSGALSSIDLFAIHRTCHCSLGSMHPLQTFPDVDSAIEKIPGAYCFYEGDERATKFITHFARVIGLIPVEIHREEKALYHAAAVMASNYLVTLLDMMIETARLSGIDQDKVWPAFRPLIYGTLENVGRQGTAPSLTGPISRGDIDTVRKHLQSLDRVDPAAARLYRELGIKATTIAARRNAISTEKLVALVRLLKT